MTKNIFERPVWQKREKITEYMTAPPKPNFLTPTPTCGKNFQAVKVGTSWVCNPVTITYSPAPTPIVITTPVNSPKPVDCAGYYDTVWSDCKDKTQTMTFNVTTAPVNGGKSCPTDKSQSCTSPTPVDCDGSYANTYSTCTNGKQTMEYNVKVPASNGGKACPAPKTKSCDSNNVKCTIYNIGTNDGSKGVSFDVNGIKIEGNVKWPDVNNPNLVCIQGPDISMKNAVPDSSSPLSEQGAAAKIIYNDSVTGPGAVVSPPIILKQSAITINDNYYQYNIFESDDGLVPNSVKPSQKCNLVNTGTSKNPTLVCKEQLKSTSDMTILPSVVPAGCILQNTGTQTNPVLSCSKILNDDKKTVSAPVKVSDTISQDISSSGISITDPLTSVLNATNPYQDHITSLNASASWSCPAGYIAQYPNQGISIIGDVNNSSTTSFLNPANYKKPCIGPAATNFKLTGTSPVGILDNSSSVQCQYGYPIMSGIISMNNNKSQFTGNVMCLYDKGEGQII
jgi:hypothetical protein